MVTGVVAGLVGLVVIVHSRGAHDSVSSLVLDAAPAVAPARGGDSLSPADAENVRPRIRVEVLNATHRRGLARRATRVLRDAGFDVVEIGNAPGQRDTTVVFDRTGHLTWAREAAAVLQHAKVSAEPDSSRYVDLSVFLGESWTPPPQPFRP